jgi:hypothetical protein
MPEDLDEENEIEFPSLRSHRRSATLESVSSTATKHTTDMSKSTKRLTIGQESKVSVGGSAVKRPSALPMLKTTSAPSRSSDVASDRVLSPREDRAEKGKRGPRPSK